jgi:serine/threonine protein kinase
MNQPGVCMQEFCVGGSLAKLLSGEHLVTPNGGVHVTRVLTVLRHVASGMAYMHKLRMVHGDLNPGAERKPGRRSRRKLPAA